MNIEGDNDIGGEHAEIIKAETVTRFKKVFQEKAYVDVKNLTRIFNINLLTHEDPHVTKKTTAENLNRIIISHISLLSYPGYYSDKV